LRGARLKGIKITPCDGPACDSLKS
jgi:hypothetical protein